MNLIQWINVSTFHAQSINIVIIAITTKKNEQEHHETVFGDV